MTSIRRKGVALVDTHKGILLVAGKSKWFMLPGGGAKNNESRKNAAIRELCEETRLKTKKCTYLFSYVGGRWHTRRGAVRNHAKVFLIEPIGNPRPSHEIKYIDYWKPNVKLKIRDGTKKVIEKYLKRKRRA